MKQAGAGAFLDVLVAMTGASIVLLLSRFEVSALPALFALIGLGVADASLRYFVIRYRALK